MPARISSTTLRSSIASFGSSATRIFCSELGAPRLQLLALGLRHAAHFRIGRRIRYQLFGAGEFGLRGAIGLHCIDQRVELGELARDLDIALGIHLAEQLVLERGVVGEQDIEFGFG